MDRISEQSDLIVAADCLNNGGILCYPTETFYALGADPWNEAACARLRELKGRPEEKNLPLIVSDPGMVPLFCDVSDPRYDLLATQFWPGPLTIVLRDIRWNTSHAVRVSGNATARMISRLFGTAVISTSANHAGQPPVSDPAQLPAGLIQGIDLLVDGGLCPGGLPSTIVTLLETPARILREGAIPGSEILGKL